MVKFTTDQIRNVMDKKHNIRNLSVIAHVDHGKSTLTDSLIAAAGMISSSTAGDQRVMDTRKDEQERCITIKSTGISLYFDTPKYVELPKEAEGRQFLINLIDSPGHVDFSSEVTNALRVTDGALVVVDSVEGVCVQTETVLRQALTERVKPVLTINKMDRSILELCLEPEEMYQNFCHIIESVNVILATYQDEALGDVQLYPEEGQVAFSAGLHGWGFTLTQFARMYAAKYSVDEKKIRKKLWGDNFVDKNGRWSKQKRDDNERGFCKLVLKPIKTIIELAKDDQVDKLARNLAIQGIDLRPEERELRSRALMKRVMQKWLSADRALLEMMVQHLPSPAEAQRYRVDSLYQGPLDDPCAAAIRNCDANGPLMLYVSKMVPSTDRGRFIAYGRVFSGTVRTGMQVRIMGPNFVPGKRQDLTVKNIQRTLLMMGRHTQVVDSVACGNTVGLIGLDQSLAKCGTLTDMEDAFPLLNMTYTVSPVVRVAVEPRKAADLPKLVEGLKRLTKVDSVVQYEVTDAGQYVVCGAGELHLEVCLKDLRDELPSGVDLNVSEPIVSYRETVLGVADAEKHGVCMAKSANKHNRIFATASPLPDSLALAIDEGRVTSLDEPKGLAKVLREDYGMDEEATKRIWAFGTTGPNLLCNRTTAVQHMSDIKDSCVAAFQVATNEGVLCDEMMRGVQLSIADCTLHSEAAHRNGRQILPTCRRAFLGAQLLAHPRLVEPIFLVDITAPQRVFGCINGVLAHRRAHIFETTRRGCTDLFHIKAYLPVMHSFGFDAELRSATSGQAFPQCTFDHWSTMDGDPLDVDDTVGSLVRDIRLRKHLSAAVPDIVAFYDNG